MGEHDQGEQNCGGGEVEPHAANAPCPLPKAQPGAARALPGRALSRLLSASTHTHAAPRGEWSWCVLCTPDASYCKEQLCLVPLPYI